MSIETYERMASLRDDPIAFGEYILGRKTHSPDQRKIGEAIAYPGARVAVHSCHGSGKTWFAAGLVLWFLFTRTPSKVITTASGGRTVDTQLWSEIRNAYHHSTVPLGGRLLPKTGVLDIGPEHFGLGFATDDLNKFRGYHSPNLLVIADEAAGIHADIFLAMDGLAIGESDRILVQGNPGMPAGPFYDKCVSDVWDTIRISAFNQPNVIAGKEIIPGMVSRRWVDDRRTEWGEGSARWQMLVEGNFPTSGINEVIPLSLVEDAEARPSAPNVPITIAVDVAREGPDETVIMVLEDWAVTSLEAYVGRDTMETVGRVLSTRRRWSDHEPVQIIVDDPGVGGGVNDRLAELSRDGQLPYPSIKFHGGLKPRYRPGAGKVDRRRERFRNQRDQAWWELRQIFEAGLLSLPKDNKLRSQLTTVLYEIRSDDLLLIETKKDMRQRGATSPDRADALVMAVWARSRYTIPGQGPEKRRRIRQTALRDQASWNSSAPSGGWEF